MRSPTCDPAGENPQLLPLIEVFQRWCRPGRGHRFRPWPTTPTSYPSIRQVLRRNWISHTIPERSDKKGAPIGRRLGRPRRRPTGHRHGQDLPRLRVARLGRTLTVLRTLGSAPTLLSTLSRSELLILFQLVQRGPPVKWGMVGLLRAMSGYGDRSDRFMARAERPGGTRLAVRVGTRMAAVADGRAGSLERLGSAAAVGRRAGGWFPRLRRSR
jgi:hypothetical protein